MNFFQRNKKDVVLFMLLFIVTTLSFALGYLSAKEAEVAPIIIEQHIEEATGL